MLLRIVKLLMIPVGVLLVGSSWIMLGLFLYLSIRGRTHGSGWPEPATEHRLLFLMMVVAAFHAALMVLAALARKKYPSRRNPEESRRWIGLDLGTAVLYALIAAWCWTAWRGFPSAFLFGTICAVIVIQLFGPAVAMVWQLSRAAASIRRARRAGSA